MILPLERTIAIDEAKALRKAITRMVSAETVATMHVPLVGQKFGSMMRKCELHLLIHILHDFTEIAEWSGLSSSMLHVGPAHM